jgi:hypothetical protein
MANVKIMNFRTKEKAEDGAPDFYDPVPDL